jgi:branched-subunit amino acid ABC-type transport system permease component
MKPQPCSIDFDSGECGRYALEQGPRWLADLLYDPAPWVQPAIYGIALLAIAGALWGYRRYGLDPKTKVDVLFNGSVILFVGGAVELLKRAAEWPYLVDVALAVAIGFSAAVIMKRYCWRPLVTENSAENI